jgi:predicted acylesterase/phospholipase RssA
MDRIGSYLSYLYLLRVPILAWLLLVFLPILSVPRRAPIGSLLRGIFDLSGGGAAQLATSFALVAFVSLMAAVAAGLTARLIVLDGQARFSAGPIPTQQPGVKLLFRLAAFTAPLPPLALTLIETYRGNGLGALKLLAGIAGVALGVLAFFLIMTRVHDWLWELAFMRNDLRKAGGEAQQIANYKPNVVLDLLAAILGTGIRLAGKIVKVSPRGYVVPATGKLWNRHAFALIQLFLSLAFYVGLYLTKWNRFATTAPPSVPTLCLVLALIMLGCFAMSGLTFFFDRFRIPLLSLMALYAVFSSQFPQTDHFFLSSKLEPVPSTLKSSNRNRTATDDSPVVLVAASGGGIQSAAWTAIVLSGLKQDLQQEGFRFDCSIKVISSVSGGSVGAMYFVDAYGPDGTLPQVNGDLRDYPVVQSAEASSLDAVAWGLAYPDLGWTIAPFLKGIGLHPFTLLNGRNLTNDRGTALENAWRTTPGLKEATLSRWRQDASAGYRPAVIFNSTIVETGERFLISTADLESSPNRQGSSERGRELFSEFYADRDLDIVTAARLSATFPYVTPAARIWERDAFAKAYHLADGGYYDNYGIVSLLDWLDFRAKEGIPYPKKVIVIQIRGFPTQSSPLPSQRHGSLFDALQPLETVLNVRSTGQFSHNQVDMSFAQRQNAYPFPVYTVDFEFDEQDDSGDPVEPPLSWHLTFLDKYFLNDFWSSPQMQRKRQEFKTRFLEP